MLLCIDVRPEDIVYNENGRIVVRLRYYAEFSNGATLTTTKGETKEDFDNNKVKSQKNLTVGSNGGLSLY